MVRIVDEKSASLALRNVTCFLLKCYLIIVHSRTCNLCASVCVTGLGGHGHGSKVNSTRCSRGGSALSFHIDHFCGEKKEISELL